MPDVVRSASFGLALLLTSALISASFAQDKQPAAGQNQNQADEEENPTPAPLTVGSMAIASDSALGVDSMSLDIAIDRVTYAYRFHNKGKDKLSLTSSIALPDLEVNNEGTTIYLLPSWTAENVVGLEVKSNGQPIQTTPHVQAIALGIDRLADLKAEKIPLIPFGEDLDKALGSAKPESLLKLESLGLVTPRDPAQPDTPVIADWSLHVVHGWTQTLEPSATNDVTVSFNPIKAIYTIDAGSLAGFDALKDQACLTPQIMNAAKAMLKAKGSIADVSDITLANDGPARWLDNPAASVAVRKPSPEAIVAFCGMDAKTQDKDVVKGLMPGSSEAAGLRVLVFTKHKDK